MSDDGIAGVVFGFAIGCLIALLVGVCVNSYWRGDMVTRGYAEYDAKTAEWKWKETTCE